MELTHNKFPEAVEVADCRILPLLLDWKLFHQVSECEIGEKNQQMEVFTDITDHHIWSNLLA
jgi:hypothetical protein